MPSAGYITSEMRELYELLKGLPSAKGSGIVAAKSGYHSSRSYNRAYHPGNYSIRLSLDKQGPSGAAAAIDITLSKKYMKKYTRRLRDALKRKDKRVASIKEFYGTTNGWSVYGLGKHSRYDTPYRTSSDKSHLWHIHMSIFRADVDDWSRIKGIYEVLAGKSAPSGNTGDQDPKPAPKPQYDFPLPNGSYYFGPKSGGPKSVSGFYGRKFKGTRDYVWLKRFAKQLSKRGWSVGKRKSYLTRYGNDGKYGTEYRTLIKSFQAEMGLAVDGLLGPNTWNTAFKKDIT